MLIMATTLAPHPAALSMSRREHCGCAVTNAIMPPLIDCVLKELWRFAGETPDCRGGRHMMFRFGNCELDCNRRELHRNGIVTHVEPQVFDVLVYLMRHRDRIVSKEELIRTVWDGRILSDDTLTSRVSAARRAIGDTGAEQRLIRTVTRCGFRFLGERRQENVKV